MNLRKQLTTLLLTIAMLMMSIVPVFADDTDAGSVLASMFQAGGTIVLDSDVTVSSALTIPQGVSVDLDLNGYTIYGDWNNGSTTNHIYVINNYGNFTVRDNSEEQDGAIVSRGIYNYGAMTLESGTIDSCDGNGGYAVNNESGSTFVMNGGKVTASLEDDFKNTQGGYDATPIDVAEGNVTTLNGGEVINVCDWTFAITVAGGTLEVPASSTVVVKGGHGAVEVNSGLVNIAGGTFICTGYEGATDNVTYVSGGTLNITGGTFTADSDSASGGCCVSDAVGGAVISGGTFGGSSGGDVSGVTGGTVITGGTFENLVETAHIAVGATVKNGDSYITKTEEGTIVELPDYAAKIGGTYYETLDEALNAASAMTGDVTIEILCDIELDSAVIVSKETVLDLNGYDITYTSTVQGEAMFTNNSNFTVTDTSSKKDGTIVYTYEGEADTTYGKGNYTVNNYGTFTLEAGVVRNATAKMSHAYYTITNYTGAEVIVNGGKIICDTSRAIRLFTGSANDSIDFTLNGGTVTGTIPVYIQLASSDTNVAPEVNVNIDGGKLVATDETYGIVLYSYNYGNSANNVTINVTDGELEGAIAVTGGTNKTSVEKVNISGGTFGAYGVYSYAEDEIVQPAITITGGTFADDYAAYYAYDDNYEFVENEDGTFGVEVEPSQYMSRNAWIKDMQITYDEVPKYQVVLMSGMDSLDYDKVGFKVTVDGTTQEFFINKLYKSVTVTDRDGKVEKIVPSDFGNTINYIFLEAFNFDLEYKDKSIEFTPFVVKYDGSYVWGNTDIIDKIYE